MSAQPPPGARLALVDELEVEVEKLVAGGDGLARHEGVPIFIPRSAPGDRARIRLTERRPDYARGEILELLQPGPGRRSPPCPHFERCGGCDLQHLEDEVQVRLKAAATRETLERLGRVEWPDKVEVLAGSPWGYRLRVQLHVERADSGYLAGYRARASHELVPIQVCPILLPELEAVATTLGRRLPEEGAPARVDLAAGDQRVTAGPALETLPRGPVERRVGDFTYSYDARCFFQTHAGLLPQLVERVVGEHRGSLACDLYAGVGLFSLPLGRRYEKVVAVEGDRVAARYARNNARRNRVELEVVAQAVETWVRRLPPEADRVVADPPRRGLTPPVRKALLERRPRCLTYVSCHPAALARDLKALREAYRVESLCLLDLFPQSGHMEVVAQLVTA